MRTIILGMNNPHSEREDAALLPHPRGVAGHRLWRMTHEVCGVSRAEYCRLTERRNLLNARDWDPVAARRGLQELEVVLQGRRVVVLGATARAVMWLPATTPGRWQRGPNYEWCYLPHPSGLCRDYNDPLMRLLAGLVVEEELERAR